MEESSKKKSAATASLLPDDLIVEILSRLPAKPVHRFKCVSPSWRDLIADPAHRKKLAQTLTGLLYGCFDRPRSPTYARPFASVSGGSAPFDPSLPFLPKYKHVNHLDTCAGLILTRCYKEVTLPPNPGGEEYHYIVCNPLTQRWAELPPHPTPKKLNNIVVTRLAFDPTVSSHFHVFEFEMDDHYTYVTGADIYSSQAGAWNFRDTGLDEQVMLRYRTGSGFANGMLHLLGLLSSNRKPVMLMVDVEGKAWKTIDVPSHQCPFYGVIGSSQGSLFYLCTTPIFIDDKIVGFKLLGWCLKDYVSKEWVPKISDEQSTRAAMLIYTVAAIHPDCDIIFLSSGETPALMSYNMRRGQFRPVLDLEEGFRGPYLPYVPLFSEYLADVDEH